MINVRQANNAPNALATEALQYVIWRYELDKGDYSLFLAFWAAGMHQLIPRQTKGSEEYPELLDDYRFGIAQLQWAREKLMAE